MLTLFCLQGEIYTKRQISFLPKSCVRWFTVFLVNQSFGNKDFLLQKKKKQNKKKKQVTGRPWDRKKDVSLRLRS